jgi:hypothetical protein
LLSTLESPVQEEERHEGSSFACVARDHPRRCGGVLPGTGGERAVDRPGFTRGFGALDDALSEVYYPSGDRANVRSLEFAVTDRSMFVDCESRGPPTPSGSSISGR